LRFAYADPPYPGQSARHYRAHPDYGGEVDHHELLEQLDTFDGWALSTGSRMLQAVVSWCPDDVRVLVWCKPLAPPMGDGFMYGWEPVILRTPRKPLSPMRDWLVASPEGYTFRPRPDEDVIGAKPPAFCHWLFAAAGLKPDDEFHDLFPGSGVVWESWAAWCSQISLEVA
jgi:hypothetical protein